jgi:alkylated DNA repair dioxygenase AlkB
LPEDDGTCAVLGKALDWLHGELETETEDRMNIVVANSYEAALDEAIPWHSDKNKLIGDNPTIASISLGGPRAFCLKPKHCSPWDKAFGKKLKKRKAAQIAAGVRAVLPLFAGDLVVMTGTCQTALDHQTLPVRHTTANRLAGYPAINELTLPYPVH